MVALSNVCHRVFVLLCSEIQERSLDVSDYVKHGDPHYLFASFGAQGFLVQSLVNPNDPTDVVYLPVRDGE